MTVETAIAMYSELPMIKSTGKNAVVFMSSYESDGVNDYYADALYYLESDNGSTQRGANVYKAWDTLTEYENNGHDLNTVGVTVIDTGCRYTHEDLKDMVDADNSYEIWYKNMQPHKLLGDNYSNGVEGSSTMVHHGTHVTGIIGAKADNNIGVAGAASILGDRLDLCVIDAAHNSAGVDLFSIAAIVKAIGIASDNGTKVINLSVGVLASKLAQEENNTFEGAINAAAEAGVVFVCAAGNDSTSNGAVPSDYDAVISVINTDASGNKNSKSNYGALKEVCAPGTNILSTYGNSNTSYAYLDGTSMSAPLVSAIVALMLSVDPDLTPAEVRDILMETATDLGAKGFDNTYAAGLVNADAAVRKVIGRVLASESEASQSEDNNTERNDNENNDNNSDNSNNSGNAPGGGDGGGGGGGGGGGSIQPTVIEGTAVVNPLTGKKKFVSSAGQIYRNSWNNVEVYDSAGVKHELRIYTDANGDIVTGWQWIRCSDGQIKCSYFSESNDWNHGQLCTGMMAPDGRTIDTNGYWTVNGVVQLSDKETVSRIPVPEAAEIAAAAAERAKSPVELGYIPGQIIAKVSGTRQQIDAYVASMGGRVASIIAEDSGTSTVLINISNNTTVSTAQALYKGNPLFKSVSKNAVMTLQ